MSLANWQPVNDRESAWGARLRRGCSLHPRRML